MLNQIVLVGRIIDIDPYDNTLRVEIPRTQKENGEYKKDKITITVPESMIDNIKDYCKVQDLIGVKGRIQESYYNVTVIAEKITFLSNSADKDSTKGGD